MTDEEIHNIYLHMSGKAEGLVEATGEADFPVLFARAIIEYSKKQWVRLEKTDMPDGEDPMYDHPFFIAGMVWAANKLRKKNT
jgi:hypothetical protein